MADSERWQQGLEKFNEVYAGDLPTLPEGTMPFMDVMLKQLFGEVWTRPALSTVERRLLTIGVIAALGEREAFAIQIRSALKNGELTEEQCREIVIHLAQYAGYPRVAMLVREVEHVISEVSAARQPARQPA